MNWQMPLLGGCLIGVSVALMMWANGRVVGISGIINQAATGFNRENMWRWMFLLGLALGGTILFFESPELFHSAEPKTWWQVVLGGILVGFGTTLGSGCTSGHGVCGVSRFSPRSLLATVLFMLSGAVTVFILKQVGLFS